MKYRYKFCYYDEKGKKRTFGEADYPTAFLKTMQNMSWINKPFVIDKEKVKRREKCLEAR